MAEWTGVPLVEVLDWAGVTSGAQEVLFRGVDSGTLEGLRESIHFERSLRIDEARAGTTKQTRYFFEAGRR